MATSEESLQRNVDIFDEVCTAYGQTIAVKKTEIMATAGKKVIISSV
jgi:hypothetical protein